MLSREPTTLRVRVLSSEDKLWEVCLSETSHDFYHRPKYVAICAEHEGGQPCALLVEEGSNRLLIPLILRPIGLPNPAGVGQYDATSPYGYPSPLVWSARQPRPADPMQAEPVADASLEAFLERALEAIRGELLTRGVVSLFVRFHPLLAVPLEPFRRHGTVVHHGQTVYIDLRAPEEEQWSQMRPPYRNRIRRAPRAGLIAEIDSEWDSFDDFFEIYNETMRRVQAVQYYFFPKQYFLELRDALDGDLHLVRVRIENEIASVGLFSDVGGIVQLHLTGNRMEYAEHHASKYLIDFVRRRTIERGDNFLHLGGGLGAQDDSLLYFKAGFSKLRGDFHTFRAIVHAEAYQKLVCQWQQQVGMEVSGPDEFFPAYRKFMPPGAEPRRAPLAISTPARTSRS